MDWASILGIGASAASGGVFGLIGSGIGAVAKFFTAKQEMAFEQLRWAHEDKLLELQMKQKEIENEQELAIVAQSGSWNALQESLKQQAVVGQSYPWVNAVKSLFRPFITTVLLILIYLIFIDLMAMFDEAKTSVLGKVFTDEQAGTMVMYIVNSMVFAATTALTWWFADRAFAPPGMKNR